MIHNREQLARLRKAGGGHIADVLERIRREIEAKSAAATKPTTDTADKPAPYWLKD